MEVPKIKYFRSFEMAMSHLGETQPSHPSIDQILSILELAVGVIWGLLKLGG